MMLLLCGRMDHTLIGILTATSWDDLLPEPRLREGLDLLASKH
jgi:hypothetical protein